MIGTHEELRRKIADYLTKQFVWDEIDKAPKDECLPEADHILALVAEETKDTIPAQAIRIDPDGPHIWTQLHRASSLWPPKENEK